MKKIELKDLNPAVDRKVLLFLAGFAWSSVGVLLLSYSVKWLLGYSGNPIVYALSGALAAGFIHWFAFSRIAAKNLQRLLPLKDKRCLFSFITWKSYLIIPVMILMGITLRHSDIPKQYLSVVYTGIGLALLISGLNYFRHIIILLTGKITI